MRIIHEAILTLDTEQIQAGRGIIKRSRADVKVTGLLRELLAATVDGHLLEPAIVYELYPVAKTSHDRICLRDGTVLHSTLLPISIKTARELAAIVCTIGPRLENEVFDYFAMNKPLIGLALDSIGNAALDCLMQEACQLIKLEALSRSLGASRPFSPGMPGWSVSEQHHLFRLVPAEQIGVSLTPSAMMIPRKSLSMVIGIGPDMPGWTLDETCDHCSLKRSCSFRSCPPKRLETV